MNLDSDILYMNSNSGGGNNEGATKRATGNIATIDMIRADNDTSYDRSFTSYNLHRDRVSGARERHGGDERDTDDIYSLINNTDNNKRYQRDQQQQSGIAADLYPSSYSSSLGANKFTSLPTTTKPLSTTTPTTTSSSLYTTQQNKLPSHQSIFDTFNTSTSTTRGGLTASSTTTTAKITGGGGGGAINDYDIEDDAENYTPASYLTKSRPFTSTKDPSAAAPNSYPYSSSNLNSNTSALDKILLSHAAAAAASPLYGGRGDGTTSGPIASHHFVSSSARYHPIPTTSTTTSTTSSSSYLNSSDRLLFTSAATTGATKSLAPTATTTTTSGSQNILQRLFDDMRQIEDTVDSLEIPVRGRCRVYMAKYGYDPFKQSPNENPDAELAFNAGDYILVFDDIDEDGYFIGELMDGRRGYVPSNWLDRLTGEDLFEFQASTLYKHANGGSGGGANKLAAAGANLGGDDELDSNTCYPPEFYDAILTDTMNHSNFQHLLAPEDYHRMNDYVDLDDVDEVDDECLSDYERAEAEQMRRQVPPPQRLVLERQLNKCILIAWLHPQTAKGTIVSYQVYVDGVLKSTVPSGDRTKALLEGVDSTIAHRISVRAIDSQGRHSNDAGCTIVIGQKVPFAPSCVKASHITSDSALISWLPSNSNFHHVVAVNSVEVQTVRPGVYKHLINGLSANTLYRVWVRAKPGKLLAIDAEKNPHKKLESLTTYVDFKTMPKSLPDPPVNVQVEAGPQRKTLLVTWLPLTLNDFGSSNGCAVTGYAVFAGHKKLADIDSPTGDHALLHLADLESLHKKSVTVRTKSGENLSQDSMPCQIPDEYLKSSNRTDILSQPGHHNHPQQQQHSRGQSAAAANAYHHHRISNDSNLTATGAGTHSPRHQQAQRHFARQHHPQLHGGDHSGGGASYRQQQQQLAGGSGNGTRYGSLNQRGRQMTRSLQNLESDLESRRSSIPAIEITRETSVSDMMINPTESYSEEEFENSMRFRGGAMHRNQAANRAAALSNRRYRPRQSHSVDSTTAAAHQQMNHQRAAAAAAFQQQQQQQANLNGSRMRATPSEIKFFVALFDYDPSTMSPNPNAAADELAFKEGSIIKVYGGPGEDGFYKGELDAQMGYVPCNVITEITDANLLNSLYEKEHLLNQQQQQYQNMQQQQQQMPTNANPAQMPTSANHHQQTAAMQQQMRQQLNQPANGAMGSANQATPQQRQLQQQQQPQQQLDQKQQSAQAGGGGVKRMVALYDYDPQENSPNADTESEIPFKVGDVIHVYGKMDADGFYMGEVERTKQRGLVPSNFLREEPLKMQPQQQLQMGNPQSSAMSLDNQQLLLQQQQQRQPLVAQPGAQQQFMPPNQQQPQPGQQMDMTGGAMGPQQQQMRAPGAMHPGLPVQNQMFDPQQQQQQTAGNINRPTTLSLGSNQQPQQQQQQPGGGFNVMPPARQMNPMQAQQQQGGQQFNQMQQGLVNPQQQFAGGAMMPGQQQQQPNQLTMQNPMQMNNNNNMNLQQQQQLHPQQQQQQGGVLSNLLSSGKQMIGAATTPRAPMQPGQFNPSQPMSNQQQNPTNAGAMMGGMQAQANFRNMNPNNNTMMIRGPNPPMAAFNAQQQPGGMVVDPSQQHQQLNQMAMGQNAMKMDMNHNPMQQQQPYNQMMGGGGGVGFNRPGMGGGGGVLNAAAMNQMGDEQGGNILNTVKNMFKL